jgi:hypothetical protein
MFETLHGTGWPMFLNITVLYNVYAVYSDRSLQMFEVGPSEVTCFFELLVTFSEGDRYKRNGHHRDCLKTHSSFFIVFP